MEITLLFGSTVADVMRLLYQLAEGNGINVEFCKANEKSSARNFIATFRITFILNSGRSHS
jgi:hypothetical protein